MMRPDPASILRDAIILAGRRVLGDEGLHLEMRRLRAKAERTRQIRDARKASISAGARKQ